MKNICRETIGKNMLMYVIGSYKFFLFYNKMSISGQYKSLQPVNRGDLVQLVYGRDNYVMRLYRNAYLHKFLTGLDVIESISSFFEHTAIVQRIARGHIVVILYGFEKELWRKNFYAIEIFEPRVFLEQNSVYVLFDGNGGVILPNSNNIGVSLENNRTILYKSNYSGHEIGYTQLRGANFVSMGYDYGLNNPFFFGESTGSLYIQSNKVADKTEYYSFVIFLFNNLSFSNIITLDNIDMIKCASYNKNISYVSSQEDEYILNTILTNQQSSSTPLGIHEPNVLKMYKSNIALTLKVDSFCSIRQYSYNLSLLRQIPIPVPTVEFKTDIVQFGNKFIVYMLYKSLIQSRHLMEYNFYDDIISWQLPVNVDNVLLSGSYESIVISSRSSASIYQKKIPNLVGVVGEVLWPIQSPMCDGGKIECPPGFDECDGCPGLKCQGYTGPCCPQDDNLPYIVSIDFLLTEAFKPVIPGQEYFITPDGKVTTNGFDARYLGTAINYTHVLMIKQ